MKTTGREVTRTTWEPRIGEVCRTRSGIESVVCFIGTADRRGHKNIITRPRLRFLEHQRELRG